MRMEISNRTPEQIASELNFIKEQSGKCCIGATFDFNSMCTVLMPKAVLPGT
ncbi:hypothetical protein [Desulfosporosinus lacus]|uniref:hypothetical protein n=1 Tax=Desulfosporosinus lacus TaxID=329936 RepID=UPI0013563E2D|nr:hypothetical protein [Desulfosporosinus lacus]